MEKHRRLGLWAVTLVLLWAAAVPARADYRVEKDLKLAPGGQFVLDSDVGSVSVTGISEQGAKIVITANRDDVDELINFDFEATASGVRVTARKKDRFQHLRNLNLHYEIRVPVETRLDIHTGGGAIEASSTKGDASLRTSGGAIEASQIAGNVDTDTSGGGVRVAGLIHGRRARPGVRVYVVGQHRWRRRRRCHAPDGVDQAVRTRGGSQLGAWRRQAGDVRPLIGRGIVGLHRGEGRHLAIRTRRQRAKRPDPLGDLDQLGPGKIQFPGTYDSPGRNRHYGTFKAQARRHGGLARTVRQCLADRRSRRQGRLHSRRRHRAGSIEAGDLFNNQEKRGIRKAHHNVRRTKPPRSPLSCRTRTMEQTSEY